LTILVISELTSERQNTHLLFTRTNICSTKIHHNQQRTKHNDTKNAMAGIPKTETQKKALAIAATFIYTRTNFLSVTAFKTPHNFIPLGGLASTSSTSNLLLQLSRRRDRHHSFIDDSSHNHLTHCVRSRLFRRQKPWGKTHLFSSDHNDIDSDESSSSDGSILGASLLFAGTAVGAGMLALPAETLSAGFIPSIFGLILCWAFTYVTSMVTLEACWLTSKLETIENNSSASNDGDGGGFLSISKRALGSGGEIITAGLFWFLLTAIIVAYTGEGGQIISEVVTEITHSNSISPGFGSAIFALFFGSLVTYGTSKVDVINRVFVLGLVATFIGLVGIGLPIVKVSNLVNYSDWSSVYPAGISIGILAFGAQNVVPTLLRYLDNDPMRTRRAILFGSLLPLLLYTIWEAVFLGIIDTADALDGKKMEVVSLLGQSGGAVVTDLVEIFSICAIGSSMAGASVSLVDFFQDAMRLFSSGDNESEHDGNYRSEFVTSRLENSNSRILAAALALGPPVVLAYSFPDVFLVALEEAGLLGGVSLYGIIPALSIMFIRRSIALRDNESNMRDLAMPGKLGLGDFSLLLIVAISSGLILPEIIHLGQLVLHFNM
ncbi:hypothetical protein ACHAXS_014043, partial [Conticribra weissflogii]